MRFRVGSLGCSWGWRSATVRVMGARGHRGHAARTCACAASFIASLHLQSKRYFQGCPARRLYGGRYFGVETGVFGASSQMCTNSVCSATNSALTQRMLASSTSVRFNAAAHASCASVQLGHGPRSPSLLCGVRRTCQHQQRAALRYFHPDPSALGRVQGWPTITLNLTVGI